MQNLSKIQAVVLAAGKGTRMNNGRSSAIPKVLFPLVNQPIVSYVIETFKKLGIVKPILVVGYKAGLVRDKFGSKCQYVLQRQRMGTAHAAKLGVKLISDRYHDIIIVQGDDSAFYKKETLKKIIIRHQKNKAVLTFLTARIPNTSDIGRVIRDGKGNVCEVVEKEDMTEEQAKLDEINCGAYIMDLIWAKKNLPKIKKHYKGGKEYPLPDIIKLALGQKVKVVGITIDSAEWIGINTPEQYQRAEEEMRRKLGKISNF